MIRKKYFILEHRTMLYHWYGMGNISFVTNCTVHFDILFTSNRHWAKYIYNIYLGWTGSRCETHSKTLEKYSNVKKTKIKYFILSKPIFNLNKINKILIFI